MRSALRRLPTYPAASINPLCRSRNANRYGLSTIMCSASSATMAGRQRRRSWRRRSRLPRRPRSSCAAECLRPSRSDRTRKSGRRSWRPPRDPCGGGQQVALAFQAEAGQSEIALARREAVAGKPCLRRLEIRELPRLAVVGRHDRERETLACERQIDADERFVGAIGALASLRRISITGSVDPSTAWNGAEAVAFGSNGSCHLSLK